MKNHITRPSNGRLFRRFFCGLTLRYHKTINYKSAIYGGVIWLVNKGIPKVLSLPTWGENNNSWSSQSIGGELNE